MSLLSDNAALVVVDMQEDFCEPHGSLAVKGGREVSSCINKLLYLPFNIKVASRDYHPHNHCSFASQHIGQEPFTSTHIIRNPEAYEEHAEEQSTTLWPDHCVQGTKGCELVPELDTSRIQHTINKGEDSRVESYSAFGPPFRKPAVAMTKLQSILKDADIERIYVCGLAYDYCVKSTAIDAVRLGFETFVIEDATEAVDQSDENLAAIRKDLEEHGVQLITSNVIV